MPSASRTINKKQLTRNNIARKFLVSRFQFLVPDGGFTLIEILLSLFFIIAIVTILLSTSGSLLTRRRSDQQSIAAKAATKEIERLRGLDFATLKTQGNLGTNPLPNSCPTQYPAADPNNDLKNLRNGQLCRNLYDYAINASTAPSGTTKVVGVAITVYWKNDNNASLNLPMDTIIYESGL